MSIEGKPLDIDGLRLYQKQNPVKFKFKFGDLDLDNLPVGFNIEEHKKTIVAGLPKTPLLNQFGVSPVQKESAGALPVVPAIVKQEDNAGTVACPHGEVKVNCALCADSSVVGGNTLENKPVE